MKKLFQLSIVALILILSSCATTYRTNTAKTMDVYGAGVIQTPVVVDLDVNSTKITGTSTANEGSSLAVLRQEAVANAIKAANADVLVEPKFETETSKGKITCTVKGFAGTYKNFHQLKDTNEMKLLNAGIVQKAEVYQPASTEVKKRKGVGAIIVLAVIGFVGLITLLASGSTLP